MRRRRRVARLSACDLRVMRRRVCELDHRCQPFGAWHWVTTQLFGAARDAPETEHLRVKRTGTVDPPLGVFLPAPSGNLSGFSAAQAAARPSGRARAMRPIPVDSFGRLPGGSEAQQPSGCQRIDRRTTDLRVGPHIGLLGARQSRDFAFPIPLGRCGTPDRS
jgi:hypothetical protein